MELQSEENGDTISIPSDHTTTTLGRSNAASNPTVSRRHVSLKLTPESTLSFEVIGKNPILVLTNGCKKICRSGEKGELREGDRLSLSIQRPSRWVVKRGVKRSILEAVKRRERRTLERRREREERAKEEFREGGVNEEFELELEVENFDLSNIDPVEEFGFLVMGHEFDKYQKGKICPMKNWNWYLDIPKENSDNSENENDTFTHEASTSKNKSSRRSKKRGKEGEEDEDWSGKSEEEKDLIAKDASGLKRSKYTTRSKDLKKPRKETVKDEEDTMVRNGEVDDEDDETLGGFIVTGEEEEEEEEINNEEEDEKEEFEDEKYED